MRHLILWTWVSATRTSLLLLYGIHKLQNHHFISSPLVNFIADHNHIRCFSIIQFRILPSDLSKEALSSIASGELFVSFFLSFLLSFFLSFFLWLFFIFFSFPSFFLLNQPPHFLFLCHPLFFMPINPYNPFPFITSHLYSSSIFHISKEYPLETQLQQSCWELKTFKNTDTKRTRWFDFFNQ